MRKLADNNSENDVVADAGVPVDMEPLLASMTDPVDIAEKSKRIAAAYRLKEPNVLTVGDLSFSKQRRDEIEKLHPVKDAQLDGLTVGSLFEGRGMPQVFESDSHRALRIMLQKQRHKLGEVRKMKKIMELQKEHGLAFPWEIAAVLREP